MGQPLNPALYRRLKRHFGRVRISGEGEALIARAVHDAEDMPRLSIQHSGEYYQVCCPYCRDTRFRLYVNHMYGKTDGHGRTMNYLAVCYNEGCLSRPENKNDFADTLDDTGEFLKETRVYEGRIVPDEAREVMWPGPVSRLDRLDDTHPAKVYLADRDFDVDKIAKRFAVAYCSDSHFFLAKNRIIIPVFEKEKLKGWQARYIGELEWKNREKRKAGMPPKYFSCPDSQFRSRCIYNFDSMVNWQTGIIVEGPTDVWRFGAMSGCVFGNTMTQQQRRKFLRVFRKRSAVLLLDPEEFDSRSTQRLISFMTKRMSGRFCAVKLPESTDPGSLDRDFMREYVRRKAAKQGVEVVYKKVA